MMLNDSAMPVLDRIQFEKQLRAKGKAYHIHHPYNVMLNTGKANKEQIRGWVANRFYYQQAIPLKDGAVPVSYTHLTLPTTPYV